MPASGGERAAGGDFDPEVDRTFRAKASRLRRHQAEDAHQEMWLRWLRYRYGSRARAKEALANTVGRSVVNDHFRRKRRSREDSVEPDALAEYQVHDGTAASPFELVDDLIEVEWVRGMYPKLLDDLCPPEDKPKKRKDFITKRTIFVKTFGERRTDADVAQELGLSERWVAQCRRDVMEQLLPLILRYQADDEGGSARSGDKP